MSVKSAEDLATALGGKRDGTQFIACCPSHDDSTPSLTIRDGDDGRILVYCHGGCRNADVINVLKTMDLWPSPTREENHPRSVSSSREEKAPATFPNLESLQSFLGKTGSVRLYHYPLVNSIPWGMARIDRSSGKKTFRAWHQGSGGKILLSKPPVQKLPLYHAEQLPDDKTIPVWIVEGEKCADALTGLGVPAVTSANGAGSAKHSDWSALDDRPVVIWPDNDLSGKKYRDEVIACLGTRVARLDVANVEALGIEEGEDCADWIAAGHTDLSGIPMIKDEAPKIGDDDPHLTDLGNCFRLVRRHGENIRYVGAWKKWLVWQGNHWKIDNAGAVERFAKDTVLRIPEEIFRETERLMQTADDSVSEKIRKKIKEILGWGKKSEADNRLGAMINLTKSELQIALSPEDFDTDPFLLGVKNGVIDLRDGRLIEPRRDQYITKNSKIDYQPGAKAPIWEKFLERIQPDPDVRAFLQRWGGYCLTGDTSEQCFTIFYGTGNNGKTTLVDTFMHILGTWARQADFKTFVMKDRDAASNDLARLFGTRLVTATESQENTRLDEAVIKSLTGGDRITARYLYSEFFEYTPSFKIILSSNHKPQIRGTDEGIWRRIRLVPFLVTIPEDEKDPHLKKKLFAEAPGILNWMIDGCREWQQIGLGMPEAIQLATGEYRESSDLIGRWISERCVVTPKAEGTIKDLYEDFCSWTEEEGINRPPIKRKFSEALGEKGFQKVRIGHKGLAGFYGVGLIADVADSADEVSDKSVHKEVLIEKKPEKTSAESATSADLIDLDIPEGAKN
ncbi:phage/plasmid primase, P4 family [Leptospirillum ferriphilum]